VASAIFIVLVIFVPLHCGWNRRRQQSIRFRIFEACDPILASRLQKRNGLEGSKSSFDSHWLKNSKGVAFCGVRAGIAKSMLMD
jgi:hypothetical protein